VINVKNVLGKLQDKAGVKDAVHVAIVSVRAGQLIKPGSRCSLNEFNEAVVNNKGYGIADPWLNSNIKTGDIFLLILGQNEIPNVRHVWEHPTVKFDPPTRETKLNGYMVNMANELGVSYKELMDAAELLVEKGRETKYSGSKTKEDIEGFEWYEFWSEWSSETGHKFENYGSNCCPEYEYPGIPFYFK
jgi:hypothetical protein